MVVEGVSFTVGSGEALLLTGPNGAGKTTLLRALAGYIEPARGTIELVEGEKQIEVNTVVNYVGHLNGLKPQLTAFENLAFWGRFFGPTTSTSQRCHSALGRIGLEGLEDLPVAHFSAGQKRRLALARLLVAARPVWLLDEPATALDRDGQGLWAELMAGHRANGGLVVAATHQSLGLDDARELALGGAHGVAA
jgi:heme exporter protein A